MVVNKFQETNGLEEFKMAFCSKCGAPINGEKFCPACGAPQQYQQTGAPQGGAQQQYQQTGAPQGGAQNGFDKFMDYAAVGEHTVDVVDDGLDLLKIWCH